MEKGLYCIHMLFISSSGGGCGVPELVPGGWEACVYMIDSETVGASHLWCRYNVDYFLVLVTFRSHRGVSPAKVSWVVMLIAGTGQLVHGLHASPEVTRLSAARKV